jgi:NADH:ubiquinone oxidoreductase subunit 2 (subunit N)
LINWTGFSSSNICLALAFSMILFSVSGIPPLAGFFSKLFVFNSLVFKDFYLTTCGLAIFSAVSCFYYIRLIRIFFFSENFSQPINWTGKGFGINEFFVSLLTFPLLTFWLRSQALIDLSNSTLLF